MIHNAHTQFMLITSTRVWYFGR